MSKALQEAIAILKNGGVIVYPTETSYAIGCDATNKKAVACLFAIKGREAGKTPPIIVASYAMARAYADLTTRLRSLAREHWPAPLTLVAHAQTGTRLASSVVRDNTIALRVSSHPTARALSAALSAPLIATSANRAGEPACYSVRAVKKQLGDVQPDFYLDEGALPRRKPSTIVREEDGKTIVLRQGSIRI